MCGHYWHGLERENRIVMGTASSLWELSLTALEHLGETKQRETGEGEVYKISWRVGCSPVLVTLLLRNLLTEPALDAALGILSRIVFGWILGESISNCFLLRDAIKASRTFCS